MLFGNDMTGKTPGLGVEFITGIHACSPYCVVHWFAILAASIVMHMVRLTQPTGADATWLGHDDDLAGRISNIQAMMSLGSKLGCDMFADAAAGAGFFVPTRPGDP